MALIPISVFAAGLGKLNVMSGLGEPLKADIELVSVTAEELRGLTAGIASQDAYVTQGIEKPASHNSIKVSLAKNAAGTPILKLNSAQPINEPFLDMLIQVDWSSGRLLREYTVLLDPPGYTGEVDSSAQTDQAPIVSTRGQKKAQQNIAASNASQNQEMTADAPVRATSGSKKLNKHKKALPVENAGETKTTATEASGTEYTTQRGDSLAKIARDMKPEGVTLEQMLVGLYQTNPNAFQGDNMNRLKVGQILRQPSQETLNALSHGEAKKEIKVQTANWNAYRNKLAGLVAESAPTDAEANAQSASGKIKGAAEDRSAPVTTGPKDVVKLSTGDAVASKTDSANLKVLQNKVASLQEEATAREKSVKEAQDKSASLEKQINDMQNLLAMKNGSMLNLQKQAETQAAAKVEPEKAAAAPVEAAKPVQAAKPVETAKLATAKVVVKTVPTPIPVEEPGFISSIMSGLDLGLLAPLGGALALLGGAWLYLRKKREKSLVDFEQGIMTSGGLKANTVFGNTASSSIDSGDTSFLTDFSQSANGGMIDTNDVDPIAEAEVYMAYGRDAQAEEILKDAIAKEPKRHELHLKLLEMYAASKNLSAFETVAGELYTSLGAEDPIWAKVAEIGIKLEPNNPLYQVNSQPTGSLDATDFANAPLAAEKDLDFSFDNQSLVKNFASDHVAESHNPLHESPLDKADLLFASAKTETHSHLAEVATASALAAAGMAAESFLSGHKVEEHTVDAIKDDHALDFDMGSFDKEELPTIAEPTQSAAEAFGHAMLSDAMPSLDVPTFAAPHFMPEVGSELSSLDGLTAKTDELESFEFPLTETPQTKAALDMGSMDAYFADAKVSHETDFNFDIPTLLPAAESFKNTDFSDANTFDLSTINLDLNEGATDKVADTLHSIPSVAEPIEIETKLDLVAAYIEMDDKEGAKELINEVMKEGGANQRKRAQALLEKLA